MGDPGIERSQARSDPKLLAPGGGVLQVEIDFERWQRCDQLSACLIDRVIPRIAGGKELSVSGKPINLCNGYEISSRWIRPHHMPGFTKGTFLMKSCQVPHVCLVSHSFRDRGSRP